MLINYEVGDHNGGRYISTVCDLLLKSLLVSNSSISLTSCSISSIGFAALATQNLNTIKTMKNL